MEGDEPEPTLEEIREELKACIDLIENRSTVEAATRLTKLRWRLDRSSPGTSDVSAIAPRKGKARPLFAWEYERSMHPVRGED
jgi:hypothetical protein